MFNTLKYLIRGVMLTNELGACCGKVKRLKNVTES
jgi:hypothetical protein